MRYYYTRPPVYSTEYGITYECDHPVYNKCTLFKIGNRGLAVIQQRYNKRLKTTYWRELDPWLPGDIYTNSCFKEYFNMNADVAVNKLYPTVTIRQLMWALKMKPLPKQRWETVFDRRKI